MNQNRRKRRFAIDSDTPEEFIKIATFMDEQEGTFYDDFKIKKLREIRGSCPQNKENLKPSLVDLPMFNGFEHSLEEASPIIQCKGIYSSTSLIDSSVSISEDIQSYNLMILGAISEELRSQIQHFCRQEGGRKPSVDLDVSPLKWQMINNKKLLFCSKLCLDIAVKKIVEDRNKSHVVKFLLHDTSIKKYDPIIDGKLQIFYCQVYIKQCEHFVLFSNFDREEKIVQKLTNLKNKITNSETKKLITIIMKYEETTFSESTLKEFHLISEKVYIISCQSLYSTLEEVTHRLIYFLKITNAFLGSKFVI